MSDIMNMFPSKYLKASDLEGRSVTVTISHIKMEDISRGDEKPVLYFQGKTKGLVLNVTNAKKIAGLHGRDSNNWKGAEIALYETEVEFQGDTVPAIRVRAAPLRTNGEAQVKRAPAHDPMKDVGSYNDRDTKENKDRDTKQSDPFDGNPPF